MKTRYCKVCETRLIYVDHYEFDGVTEYGSHEPYWECPNKCDEEIDTCTEYNKVVPTDNKESEIL